MPGLTAKLFGLLLAGGTLAPAQAPAVTIAQAVDAALRNYPSIHVTQEQMNAAAAAIRLAQTAYLPRVDGLLQVNRATRNTFYGLLLPQTVIPGVDGIKANNLGSVWDSGAGVLVAWQPFDFGLRRANVAAAAAGRDQAQATLNRTRYDVSVAAADAFLTVVAAQQTAEAARAAVDSWQVLMRSIHALVNAQLRPGADESRVAAELAMAQTQLAQAEQAIEIARATLAQFAGFDPSSLNVDPGRLLEPAPQSAEPPLNAPAHPLAQEQSAVVAQQQSRLAALARSVLSAVRPCRASRPPAERAWKPMARAGRSERPRAHHAELFGSASPSPSPPWSASPCANRRPYSRPISAPRKPNPS